MEKKLIKWGDCFACEEPIFEDEGYYLIGNETFCVRCIDKTRKIIKAEETREENRRKAVMADFLAEKERTRYGD